MRGLLIVAVACGTGVEDGSDTDEGVVDPADAAAICARWNADRAELEDGPWDGDPATCDAGDMGDAWRGRALRNLNLMRWLAELDPVVTEPELDAAAQQCALMLHANADAGLSHDPPESWACWTEDGARAAARSNIGTKPAVRSIDMYVQDWGNAPTLAHRRWVLSNTLGPVGIGSTDAFACVWVLGGESEGGPDWTAWPPPGAFPVEAVRMSNLPLDRTGWSLQSDVLDLAAARVTVTRGDASLPVEVSVLAPGYGSESAISFVPQGWEAEAGATYHVEVTGLDAPLAWDVSMVACEAG